MFDLAYYIGSSLTSDNIENTFCAQLQQKTQEVANKGQDVNFFFVLQQKNQASRCQVRNDFTACKSQIAK